MPAPCRDLRAAADSSPADWILGPAMAGNAATVLRYGPPGFERYLRLPVDGNVVLDQSRRTDVHPMATALRVLANHTGTPEVAYAGVWHGYGFDNKPASSVPVVPFPDAWMYLYTGPVSSMRYAQQSVWSFPDGTPDASIDAEPDLVWPADHTWCLACEVDEEIEFSIGCSNTAAQALEEALPGRVRRVTYGQDAPWERDRTTAPDDDSTT